jgi:hypothetical protein
VHTQFLADGATTDLRHASRQTAENRATHKPRIAKSSPLGDEARMLNSVNAELQDDDAEQ